MSHTQPAKQRDAYTYVLDIGVTSNTSKSNLPFSSVKSGGAAIRYAEEKIREYGALPSPKQQFVPMITDTMGAWTDSAIIILQEICKEASRNTQDYEYGVYRRLMHRLNVTVIQHATRIIIAACRPGLMDDRSENISPDAPPTTAVPHTPRNNPATTPRASSSSFFAASSPSATTTAATASSSSSSTGVAAAPGAPARAAPFHEAGSARASGDGAARSAAAG